MTNKRKVKRFKRMQNENVLRRSRKRKFKKNVIKLVRLYAPEIITVAPICTLLLPNVNAYKLAYVKSLLRDL